MSEEGRRPNVLIFMTDQQQDAVIGRGHPCRTPHADRLAAEGLRFSHVYPPMAHCCPSRASFFTGLYPSQHGIHNNVSNEQAIGRALRPGVETFSEKLSAAGYRLYFSGKWHISAERNPRDYGWEELLVRAGANGYMGTRRERWPELAAGLRERDKEPRGRGQLQRPGWGPVQLYGTKPGTAADLDDAEVVSRGIEQIERLQGSAEPWCVYIGTTGPHDPFVIPEPYASMYDPAGIELPPNYHDALTDKPGFLRRMRKVTSQLSDSEVREAIAHYWGYCTLVDELLGQTLEALDRTGQADNTLVLFLSDHGEHAGAHGLFAKGLSNFEEGYRVPCVMRWPGRIGQPGQVCDAFVTMDDFAPTLLEAASAEPLRKSSGQSLLPWLCGEVPGSWRDAVYGQCNGVEVYHTSRMVRTRSYKFVYHPTDLDELYDLGADPHELTNVADDPDYKDIKLSLYRLMWRQALQYEDTIFNPYITVATADYGPAIVADNEEEEGQLWKQ